MKLKVLLGWKFGKYHHKIYSRQSRNPLHNNINTIVSNGFYLSSNIINCISSTICNRFYEGTYCAI